MIAWRTEAFADHSKKRKRNAGGRSTGKTRPYPSPVPGELFSFFYIPRFGGDTSALETKLAWRPGGMQPLSSRNSFYFLILHKFLSHASPTCRDPLFLRPSSRGSEAFVTRIQPQLSSIHFSSSPNPPVFTSARNSR